MFDWENAIALHAMQGNRASSRGEGEVSRGFLELRQARGLYSRVTTGIPPSLSDWWANLPPQKVSEGDPCIPPSIPWSPLSHRSPDWPVLCSCQVFTGLLTISLLSCQSILQTAAGDLIKSKNQ